MQGMTEKEMLDLAIKKSEQETARNTRSDHFKHAIIRTFTTQRNNKWGHGGYDVCTLFVMLLLYTLMRCKEMGDFLCLSQFHTSIENIMRTASKNHKDQAKTDVFEAQKQLNLHEKFSVEAILQSTETEKPLDDLTSFIDENKFMSITVYEHTIAVVNADKCFYIICSLEGKVWKFENAKDCAECILHEKEEKGTWLAFSWKLDASVQ
jgi:replicative superfamily II helicase